MQAEAAEKIADLVHAPGSEESDAEEETNESEEGEEWDADGDAAE